MMASLFDDVVFTYGGDEYTVPANKVMQLIEMIEAIVPMHEINNPGKAKLARAYATAINFAGGNTNQEEVYSSFFGNGMVEVQSAIAGLAMLMVPPAHLRDNGQETKDTDEPKKKG